MYDNYLSDEEIALMRMLDGKSRSEIDQILYEVNDDV